MKKLDKFIFTVCCAFLLLLSYNSFSQALYKVSDEEKVNGSTLIIEGKVISQESFWNSKHTFIFTSNKIEVYKVFKGTTQKLLVEILTQGGSVDGTSIEASDLLRLRTGETGVFFCFPNKINLRSPETGDMLLDVYSSAQGFYSYDFYTQTASSPLSSPIAINALYTDLVTRSGRAYENKNPGFKAEDFRPQPNAPNAPVITSFSPNTVNAGAFIDVANNLLVITGSGFGTPTGAAAVLFDDANNGTGGTPLTILSTDNSVVSWTDTEIRIRTPTSAGTGALTVRDAAGVTGVAPLPLNVFFSVLTATFNSGGIFTKESNLMNDNGLGGYSIRYSVNTNGGARNFNTSAEKASFQRALTTWREVNAANFSEDGTDTLQVISPDTSNLVMFDNTNTGVPPLGSGTLAVCYSYNSTCTPISANAYQKVGFDIIVRNPGVSVGSTSFTIGPCPPLASSFSEIDLETVLLHELGHALNLGHINDSYQGTFIGELNPNKLMNFAVVNSVKRVSPDISAYLGVFYEVNPQGNVYGACALPNSEMIPLVPIVEAKDNCPGTFPTSATPVNTTVPFDLVHATSNRFSDPSYTQVLTTGDGQSLTNNAFYAFRTNSAGGVVSINVTGYTLTPSSPTTCSPYVNDGTPTIGVELALYQVPSCPTGQSYPLPIENRYFNGNGALANINGLAPNTSYLLMAHGVENTKATFNLTFTGGALPINLTDFTGTMLKDFNQLNWTIQTARDVRVVNIERSADGASFEKIGEVDLSSLVGKGGFKDYRPFSGDNYYRLATTNLDNTKEYSKIVLLRRADDFRVHVFPTPAKQVINIEISSAQTSPGRYAIVLRNMQGQVVSRRDAYLNSGYRVTSISTDNLSDGIYQVSIYDAKGKMVKTTSVAVAR